MSQITYNNDVFGEKVSKFDVLEKDNRYSEPTFKEKGNGEIEDAIEYDDIIRIEERVNIHSRNESIGSVNGVKVEVIEKDGMRGLSWRTSRTKIGSKVSPREKSGFIPFVSIIRITSTN